MLGEVNRRIISRSLDAMTTAVVVAYYRKEDVMRFSYAGHPPVLYKRANDKAWTYARPNGAMGQSDCFSVNIPLAVDLDTLYGQLSISIFPCDRLFVYTDGIIDAPNPKGESFGLARIKDTLDANTESPLSELKSAVLKNLHQHTEQELIHDDLTMIAIEIC
ncbi:MAG: serine/threonine-protein phosphatase [Deltaproteobacteria bacterium]|nr:MAG: serine/threonine-protein phosphatase [Deltaproteobacteria bacterium]